ncbi:hypothetical protein CRG98_010181 [Punica granatum]|uniref:Myb/SANT-like domain-containing protein n=1 Tax=Punica granatum TaxID=22663 RepID=A0A2I0KM94_PUNGR|nr:hypothetical protein CRG98_010181 [Punica granatum]
MAPKGANILEWTDQMELAFINIMFEKLKRSHTTSWKQREWDDMTVEMGKQFLDEQLYFHKIKDKCTRLKGMYKQFTELVNHTSVGWDVDTNTIKASPDVCHMFIKCELEFLIILVEKYNKSFKKNRASKTFRSRGCKHYRLLNELFNSSTTTNALCITSTDLLRTSDEERQLHEEFISTSKKKQNQPINHEEGFDESDDPV